MVLWESLTISFSRCVGVWDTVGAVHGTTNALGIDDDFLPPCVDVVLHAVSLQENRGKFRPTLWRVPANGLGPNQIMKEVSNSPPQLCFDGQISEFPSRYGFQDHTAMLEARISDTNSETLLCSGWRYGCNLIFISLFDSGSLRVKYWSSSYLKSTRFLL